MSPLVTKEVVTGGATVPVVTGATMPVVTSPLVIGRTPEVIAVLQYPRDWNIEVYVPFCAPPPDPPESKFSEYGRKYPK